MKKLLIFILCFLFISPYCTLALAADENSVKTSGGYYNIEAPEYATEIALLVNTDTDTVIYGKNEDKLTSPASFVKIVTAMVALSKCDNLQTKITCSKKAVQSLLGTYSTVIDLEAGEVTTLEMLLYAMFLPSANDAAQVIAYHFGNGDPRNFVDDMNEYVQKLGCKNTHFANATGFDDDSVKGFTSDTQNRTTASDMYLIAKAALKNDVIVRISSKYGKTMPETNKSDERELYNTNPLINNYSSYYYENAIGLKTGSSEKSGACVVTSATKDGYTYIAIAMKGKTNYAMDGDTWNTSCLMCRYMLRWAFDNITMRVIADTSYNLGEMPVAYGQGSDYVAMVPEKDVSAIIHTDINVDDLTVKFSNDFPEKIKAPVKQGEVIGKAKLMYKGVVVSKVTLVAQQDVKKNHIWAMFGWVEKLLSSKLFVAIVIIIIVALIIYLVLTNKKRKNKKRRKNRVEIVKDYSKLAK